MSRRFLDYEISQIMAARRRAAESSSITADAESAFAAASESRRPRRPKTLLGRMCHSVFPAGAMYIVWLLVASNWIAHVIFRDRTWGIWQFIVGHSLMALQIVAFAKTVHIHPGSPPADWPAEAGLPPRAYYLKKTGEVILGFDHHCWWLGVPIGHRNRKFFILFLLWSATLSFFGLWLSCADVCRFVPGACSEQGKIETLEKAARSGALPSTSALAAASDHVANNPVAVEAVGFHSAANVRFVLSIGLSFAELEPPQLRYVISATVLSLFDFAATLLLGVFGLWHLYLALRNRTTLAGRGPTHAQPEDEAVYDLGALNNLRQIFGSSCWLWLLPVAGDAPLGDGIHFEKRGQKAEPEI